MLGPFATASRLTPIHHMSLAVLSRAACASMSTTTTTTTTTTRDRGDRYGPIRATARMSRYLIISCWASTACSLEKWILKFKVPYMLNHPSHLKINQSINQSILEWPNWRSHCKVHCRCKMSVTKAWKWLAEQMSFQLSLEGWQRYVAWILMYKVWKFRSNPYYRGRITAFLARDVIYTSRAYATMSVSVCLRRLCIVVTGCNGSRVSLHAWVEGCLCYLLTTPHPDRRMGWCRDFWITDCLLDGWTGNSNDGFVYMLRFIGFFNLMHYIWRTVCARASHISRYASHC